MRLMKEYLDNLDKNNITENDVQLLDEMLELGIIKKKGKDFVWIGG